MMKQCKYHWKLFIFDINFKEKGAICQSENNWQLGKEISKISFLTKQFLNLFLNTDEPKTINHAGNYTL